MLSVIKEAISDSERQTAMLKAFLADVEQTATSAVIEFPLRPVGPPDEEKVIGEITDPCLKAFPVVISRRGNELNVTLSAMSPEQRDQAICDLRLLKDLMWAEIRAAFKTEEYTLGLREGWKLVRVEDGNGGDLRLPNGLMGVILMGAGGNRNGNPD
jgi:hypothetical protein